MQVYFDVLPNAEILTLCEQKNPVHESKQLSHIKNMKTA